MYYEIKTDGGDLFETVFNLAKDVASMDSFKGEGAEFEFNGVTCRVNKNTNYESLWRDYANAHTMEWKVVGPECPDYTPEQQAELDRRNATREEKWQKELAERKTKDDNEKSVFLSKTVGVEIELSDPDGYNDWKSKNQDGYGAAIFEYADGWARLMQVEIASGKTLLDCAEATSHQLGFMGITGFMYGAAVSILSKCWKHGEQLRRWHNKEYGHEGEGVVNPAILTIG